MQQIGGAVGLAVLVTISTAVQEARLPGALRVLAQAEDRSAGSPALDALVAGYSAAYTASLGMLAVAGLVAVVVVNASPSTAVRHGLEDPVR
jgi:hypothetical protein